MSLLKFKVLGVMSGTSLDGVDCAVVEFSKENDNWNFKLLQGETISYTINWFQKLKEAYQLNENDLHLLDIGYTYYLSEILNDFINKNDLNDLDFVSSHGHTILHQPENGYTLQIGNLPLIADLINLPFVCDFRVQDVELGGQGAPLVPIGDELLFADYDYCLNLGGFSNISFKRAGKRIAFDICPVNTLLNFYAEKLGASYDDAGIWASQGSINNSLLGALNQLPFYDVYEPKSLGIEQVNDVYLPLIASYNLNEHDCLATIIEHIAFQVSKAIHIKTAKVLITGGGAFNTFLIQRINAQLRNTQLVVPSNEIINFKEAIIFAFLGVLRVCNIINVLSSVTGASSDHCSGNIFNRDLLRCGC